MNKTMTRSEVLALLDRIASFNHPIDRIEVMKARSAVAALVAERDALRSALRDLIHEAGKNFSDSDTWRRHKAAVAALSGAC